MDHVNKSLLFKTYRPCYKYYGMLSLVRSILNGHAYDGDKFAQSNAERDFPYK